MKQIIARGVVVVMCLGCIAVIGHLFWIEPKFIALFAFIGLCLWAVENA